MNSTSLHTINNGWAHMPHHIYNDIASYLNSKDYSLFRLSCLRVSQSVDSFETLRQKSNNPACSKRFKHHCEHLLNDKKIRDALTGEDINDVRSALKNFHVDVSPNNALAISLKTDYQRYQKKEVTEETEEINFKKIVRVPNTIDSCRMAICNDSPSLQQNNRTHLSSFNFASSLMWCSGIEFFYLAGENLPLNSIFSGFNKVFERNNGPEKYIAATMANELKEHWLKNPPQNMCQTDMLDILEKHAALFSLGKKAKIIATELEKTIYPANY